jgi:tetratricopeptide (TPR) repeat protein
VRDAATAGGATYVPVAERFERVSGGLPGRDLFLEHVHPTRAGVTLLAQAFFDALDSAAFLGRGADRARLRSWEEYQRASTLTPFDERIALHTVQTLVTRWPFVPVSQQRDYRATYRPTGVADSLALLVSRGGLRWEEAKLQVAAEYERRAHPDSAVSEYRGLVRDQPTAEYPQRLLARALLQQGDSGQGERALRTALQLEPSSGAALALGQLLIGRKDVRGALPLLEQAVQLDPANTAALYQLSLAYGLVRDIDRARSTALALARLDPRYPGLAGWMSAIGLSR